MVSLIASTDSLKGKPHWRRTQEVYTVLNTAPSDVTYDRLIEYVRQSTGKGCSRKLISKWKKTVNGNHLLVTSKLTKNHQDQPLNNKTNVLPIVISCDKTSVDLTSTESIPAINQAEAQPIQKVKLVESQVNSPIIYDEDKQDEDKPKIANHISLPTEKELTENCSLTTERDVTDNLQLFVDNCKDNSPLVSDNYSQVSDNYLPPVIENETTANCSPDIDNCKGNWSLKKSLVTATVIVFGMVGCSWFFSKDNSKPVIAQPTIVESIQNASSNSETLPIQNQEVQNRRVQNGIPRTFKISLTVTNPQDLKVKPGDEIALGQVLSDRTTERQRLLAQKKQLEISLKKLDLPIPEITQPKPIPALSKLPPVSYQQEEANIALKQQELAEAEKAIANQEIKIKELQAIENSEFKIQNGFSDTKSNLIQRPISKSIQNSLPQKIQGNLEQQSQNQDAQNKEQTNSKYLPLLNNSDNQSLLTENESLESEKVTGHRSLVTVIEHEKVVLKKLIAARDKSKLQLDIAKSKLVTAKEQRAHIEYQRYLEETKRAIALQQQQIELERQRSIRAGQIQEREYSKAQIETKIQEIDNAIAQLSTVKAPYAGKVKKVKWAGQDNHNLTVQLTLDVDNTSEKPTITSKQ